MFGKEVITQLSFQRDPLYTRDTVVAFLPHNSLEGICHSESVFQGREKERERSVKKNLNEEEERGAREKVSPRTNPENWSPSDCRRDSLDASFSAICEFLCLLSRTKLLLLLLKEIGSLLIELSSSCSFFQHAETRTTTKVSLLLLRRIRGVPAGYLDKMGHTR